MSNSSHIFSFSLLDLADKMVNFNQQG